jgi:leucyl/phenylalanyl-tRNA--protein transferase
MGARPGPVFLAAGRATTFPDPRDADDDGLVAIGGDLRPETLLKAYETGIFPWYGPDLPPLWWSPDPRAVLDPNRLHISRSMRRVLRKSGFELSWNRAFGTVMRACAEGRDTGTWIVPEMERAYGRLHALGHAHSLEVWFEGKLAGGLYGVQRGALFAAESMFYRRTNASKIALIATVQTLFQAGIELFDVQFLTSHLELLGAFEIPRDEYLARLERARSRAVNLRALSPQVRG